MPLQVAHVTNELGLGGTVKTAVTHALAHDRDVVEPRVIALQSEGPRRAQLEAAGVAVHFARDDLGRLTDLLRGVDVVHVHRLGHAEGLLPEAARRAGVGVLVENNVFGTFDESPDEEDFACHLFPSRMCSLRYRERQGLHGPAFHARHRVSAYPVDGERLARLAPDRAAAKAALGLDPDRPVVGRLGRGDDRKWSTLLVDAVPRILALMPEAQVLLVGTTPAIRRRLARHGVDGRVALRDPVSGDEPLATLYAACDVFATTSSIGESFGVALAEAMAMGLPVVTASTPYADNAQIELVDDGVTGHVANHPQAFAEAVVALLRDPALASRHGEAGRRKAQAFSPGALTRQLERLYVSCAAGEGVPADWDPSPAAVDAFAGEYAARLQQQFRPLTAVERVQARAAVLAERATWASRDLRRDPATVLRTVTARLGG